MPQHADPLLRDDTSARVTRMHAPDQIDAPLSLLSLLCGKNRHMVRLGMLLFLIVFTGSPVERPMQNYGHNSFSWPRVADTCTKVQHSQRHLHSAYFSVSRTGGCIAVILKHTYIFFCIQLRSRRLDTMVQEDSILIYLLIYSYQCVRNKSLNSQSIAFPELYLQIATLCQALSGA
jgi:hypothetical protein